MIELPHEIDVTDDGSFSSICNRVCTSLKPSGNRDKDEEYLLGNICRILSERSQKNVSFASSRGSTKIDNLREHLILLVGNLEESDNILECVYEFLENVYPPG